MGYVIGIVLTIVALMISVALHELGHMIPAKRFGVYVPQYMVGFGPTMVSKKVGETEYGIKWFLLGGFVSLAGMFAPAPAGTKTMNRKGEPTLAEEARQQSREELDTVGEERAFYRLATWQKLVVMLGGPVTNLVLAIAIFAIVIMGIGLSQPTTTIASVPPCLDPTVTTCTSEAPRSPAAEAGIQAGDVVTSWDGHETSSWSDVTAAIAESGERTVPVTVERDGQRVTLAVRAVSVSGAPRVGIESKVERIRGGVGDVVSSVSQMVTGTASLIVTLPQQVWHVARGMIDHTPRGTSSVLSVIGVGRLAAETTATSAPVSILDRVAMLLSLWGSLNIALFVFNLIPLPPLDGGHIAGALWEGIRRAWGKLRGRDTVIYSDTARLVPLTYTVALALIVMTVVLMAADVINPIRW